MGSSCVDHPARLNKAHAASWWIAATIRATHAPAWIGFQSSSGTAIQGIDAYMKDIDGHLNGPVRMASYKMLEFDVIFYSDVALIPYVSEVTYAFPGGSVTQKLRVFDVYAKLDGPWNQVGSDTQLHPDSLAAAMENLRPVRKWTAGKQRCPGGPRKCSCGVTTSG